MENIQPVNFDFKSIKEEGLELLKALISKPSFSGDESETATLIENFLNSKSISTTRIGNNILARGKRTSEKKPVVLLNSHHDTVKPVSGWTKEPFHPHIESNKLHGLGSNDAGAALVSLICSFVYLYEHDLSFDRLLLASAEEENSGRDGVECVIPHLGKVDLAIVGEPTDLHLAIAEKGLMVLDCEVKGISGHAARDEGENALYKALPIINWFKTFEFEKKSEWLGPVKMTVTQIQAGTLHNVVPDSCKFTVDIRLNECYSHFEILDIIQSHVDCKVVPRSTRLRSSGIHEQHPAIIAGRNLNREIFGSSTMSDRALMPFPSIKVGPGKSERSHTADEYILLEELENGIEFYIKYLQELNNLIK